jgi:hypothetical protein
LRTEPAHREAFVALPDGPGDEAAVHWHLAGESLVAWADEQAAQVAQGDWIRPARRDPGSPSRAVAC